MKTLHLQRQQSFTEPVQNLQFTNEDADSIESAFFVEMNLFCL